jgi:hypothetical protein
MSGGSSAATSAMVGGHTVESKWTSGTIFPKQGFFESWL